MLRQLRLQNFRCYLSHEVQLRPLTVAVGKNNAGKSTLTEAIRLVALVVSRIDNLTFVAPPAWAGLQKRETGVQPYLARTGFDFAYAFYGNGDPPAVVTAEFDCGTKVTVYLGPPVTGKPNGQVFARIMAPDGSYVTSKAKARELKLPPIAILPQVAPFALEEKLIASDYVRYHIDSRLSHRHFRNQLLLDSDSFAEFKRLVTETWPSLQIRDLKKPKAGSTDPLQLNVRDGPYIGEVSQMGSGLQMWLQMMWFIARTPAHGIVILDEPDVYMHPDLQRRVIRIVSNRFHQVLVATHSVEIMTEVSPNEILVVDRGRERSDYANTLPNVQRLLDAFGSVHNVHLARLWYARRFILVEGQDLPFLTAWHKTLFPTAAVPLDDVPNAELGGYSGFQKAVGTSMALSNGANAEIHTYCFLDSDYYTEDEKAKRRNEARRARLRLWIWSRKEIENYLLQPEFLTRYIEERSGNSAPSLDTVTAKLESICTELRKVVEDGYSDQLSVVNRRWTPSRANQEARGIVDSSWATLEQRLAIVPGKEALGLVSSWAQDHFGVNLNALALARAMKPGEIPEEVRKVLHALEHVREL